MEIILGAFIIAAVIVVVMIVGLVVLARRQGGFRLVQGDTRYKAGYHKHTQSDFYRPDA
jgi:hypothetical protein